MRGARRREFEAVNPPRRPLTRLEATPSPRCPGLAVVRERATLSRDGARIRRILAACRTSSGNVVRTRRVLTASGNSPISRTDARRVASFEPRSSVASLPVVSSRGVAARAGRGTSGPSRLASPGERRSPELAAHSAANAGVRPERLALSVRQGSVDRPAETGSLVSTYLNTTHSTAGKVRTVG